MAKNLKIENSEKNLSCDSLEQLGQIAASIVEFAGAERIWFINGDMAAGKTTLVVAICKLLGCNSAATSPTYSLVNEYITNENTIVYHFDFYRLKTALEALDYGLDEYFDSGNICICEWPQNIESLWPEHYLWIDIVKFEGEKRGYHLKRV